ncbi:hypothetical protein F3Y22_tig00116997pilonHSYRG00188 [Hibiscus syriacus]|uniref:C2H2-type domain-containing protein n=1 Tax=Hibiscus syriacus TaxID=106335 RepID=A0A6A2XE35_HIBSY|nr:hypothetical protein F3Y22_tig00116997pilonHSYRG00188 [Hibiscus syriacus]
MRDPKEEEEDELHMSHSADSLAVCLKSLKTAHQDSTIILCRYCSKGFKSRNALHGHIRIHTQYLPRSKPGINPPPEEYDDGRFACLVCNQSFSSMQLLCLHMRIHRRTVPNGVHHRPAATSQEADATVKLGIEKTVSPLPLRFCHGTHHPQMRRRKTKTEEGSSSYQDMDGVADSESTLLANPWSLIPYRETTARKLETQNSNKSNQSHERRSMKAAKENKSVHQCEICGKSFATVRHSVTTKQPIG